MPHRSIPPSQTNRARTTIAMLRGVSFVPPGTPNPRVQVFPSADGTVLLIGVTLTGQWVAEYRCLAEDFDNRCVLAMERRVRAKERAEGPQLVP